MPRDIIHTLSKGKSVQLKHGEICDCGLNIKELPMHAQKKIASAYHSGKGVRITPDDVQGSGFSKGTGFTGKGIFGKKGDKLLKKAGIKKAAYKVGDAAKPFVQQGLQSAAMAGSNLMPAAAPALQMAAQAGSDYLDEPKKYQKMGRLALGTGLAAGQNPKFKAISTSNSTMLYPTHPAIVAPVPSFRGFVLGNGK